MFRLTRTPFRISFLGGGSDYPQWHQHHIGMVLGASINKYCYITYQDGQERFRLLYSKLEECESVEEIQHPAIKNTLIYTRRSNPASISHACDLPSRSGIGSSSAFVVGLLAATKGGCWDCLAKDAIRIEQDVLNEPVGNQDQILCAKGGLNQIVWHPTGEMAIRTLELPEARLREFRSHLMLFYTQPRPVEAPESLTWDVEITRRLASMAKDGADILTGNEDIWSFGYLLDDAWHLKKQMSSSISNDNIDTIYQRAKDCGAIGGKLLGAGGGGFMLLFVPPVMQDNVRQLLGLKEVEGWDFEFEGCKVVYNA